MESMTRSSMIQDIMKKSYLINQGDPERYQLRTNKIDQDQNGYLRFTFGEKDSSKVNKTILIVGETGTGKSSLINAMVNYVMGVEMENHIWFEIIEEEGKSQTESHTSAVTVYEVFGFEELRVPFSLTLIDTPGYGDTREDNDKLIADQLLALLRSENGIHQIHAVGLVVPANTSRLTESQKYIFDSVLSLFGKDLEKCIVALITFSTKKTPRNALEAITAAKVPCAMDENNCLVYFLFNNGQSEQYDKKYDTFTDFVNSQKSDWELGSKNFEKFFQFLKNMEPKSVKMTEGVLKERKQLEAFVGHIHERIKEIEGKQNEIKQTQEVLERHKTDREENKDFSYTVEETYKEKVSTEDGKKATTCTVCNENCHYPGCWWVSDLSWCSSMRKYHCTVCTGKCHYSKHEKGPEKYVLKKRVVTKTYAELKKKYEINEGAIGKKVNLINKLQTELEQLKLEKDKLVEQSYQCIIKLQDIALKALSLSTAQHLYFLIEKLKETGDTEKGNKLDEMKKILEEQKSTWRSYLFKLY